MNYRVVNLQMNGKTLVSGVKLADSFVKRLKGLMGVKSSPSFRGLLLPKCNSIHMFFMKMDIDAVFLAKDGEVLQVNKNLKTNQFAACWKASTVLELKANMSDSLGIVPGVKLIATDGGFQ